MLKTERSIIDWAFKNKVVGITSGFTQVGSNLPENYIELTGLTDSIRASHGDFTRLFELGLGTDLTVCRLINEQQMKAEQIQKDAEVEKVERKELARLSKKYA